MVTYTNNLKLAKPEFDHEPWDEEINGDMDVIDSAFGSFFSIPNYTGLWRNATVYTTGKVVTDIVDSSLWTAVISHTSAAVPTTFAQDRAANPTYWSIEIASATDLADQAAASAAAAAASASAAASAVAAAAASAADALVASTNSVLKAGSTMTGPLILSADPIVGSPAFQAATKSYVDARVGGTGFLPTSGGTISGNLVVTGTSTVNSSQLVGGTLTVGSSFVAQGGITQLSHNIRAYTPGQIPVIYGFNQTYNAAAGFHVDTEGNFTFGTYNGAGALVLPLRGSISPIGGLSVAASIYAGTTINAGTSITWGGGNSSLFVDASTSTLQFSTDGWKWQFNRTNGQLTYRNSLGTDLFHITSVGNTQTLGNFLSLGARLGVQHPNTPSMFVHNPTVSTAGGIFIDSPGQMRVGPMDAVGNPLSYWGTFHNQGLSLLNDGSMYFIRLPGPYTNLSFDTNYFFQLDPGRNLSYYRGDGQVPFQCRIVDASVVNYIGPMYAQAFIPTSDARFKENVADMIHGLDVLVTLRPVSFTWINENRPDYGFIAQEVQPVLPEAVTIVGIPIPGGGDGGMDDANPSLGVDNSTIMALAVNSIKQLAVQIEQQNIVIAQLEERIETLEAA